MYVPRQFREERRDVLARAVRRIEFAVLITPSEGGLAISHVPMILKDAPDGAWLLEAHVARPNAHWRAAATATGPSVAIFQGPQAYVSPSWYATKHEHGKVVPTWNYIAVHAHGMLEAVDDERWLHAHVRDLTRSNEAEREHSWEVEDAPADFIAGQLRGIVGLRLTVTRMDAAWKMAQHRSEGDRLGAIAGLERELAGAAVAEAMRDLEAARHNLKP